MIDYYLVILKALALRNDSNLMDVGKTIYGIIYKKESSGDYLNLFNNTEIWGLKSSN